MRLSGNAAWSGLICGLLLVITGPAGAMKLKPFDTPPPAIDPAKIATMKPGTQININYDEIVLVGTRGYAILKIGAKNPIPSNILPAATGVELRLRGNAYVTGLKPVEFMTRVSGEQRIVTAYLGVFADNGRVAACGYYIRKDSEPFAADFFFDLRSYVDVGGAFRLPAAFLQDLTTTPKRADGKLPARCVDTNVEWDPAYLAMPISLHLVDTPFAYEWIKWQTVTTAPTLPNPSVTPAPKDAQRAGPYN